MMESRALSPLRFHPDLETIVLVHVGTMLLIATWYFGGGSPHAVTLLCLVGAPAPILTARAFANRKRDGLKSATLLLPLYALAAFNLLVLSSLMHPSFLQTTVEGADVLVPVQTPAWFPDCARPTLALPKLWLYDAIALSSYNLLLAVRHRKSLSVFFSLLAANAVLLSIFGSFQKLASSPGLFFGAVASPNPSFFATFVYHNHWGAYILLTLAIGFALLFDSAKKAGDRGFWYSPAPLAAVGTFFAAATIPLSGSRACTLLATVLVLAALIHAIRSIIRRRNEQQRSIAGPVALIFAASLLALAAIVSLARPVIDSRIADTKSLVRDMQRNQSLGARTQLYRDTCRMIAAKPWYGWGLGSYGTVFRSYNTQNLAGELPQHYENAHSDWLQLTAETGVAGLACCVAFALLSLLPSLKNAFPSAAPGFLLAGCALIALYAVIEFPFGNPAVCLLFWTCYFGSIRWIRFQKTGIAP